MREIPKASYRQYSQSALALHGYVSSGISGTFPKNPPSDSRAI